MKVLVLCEYSGRVRDAFIKRGHDAISCDLLPTDVDGPHHQGDVHDMLDQDWDLIIAHPPCTALTVAGNSTYGEGQPKYAERLAAVEWTVALWEKMKERSKRVCLENPVERTLAWLGRCRGRSMSSHTCLGIWSKRKQGFGCTAFPSYRQPTTFTMQ